MLAKIAEDIRQAATSKQKVVMLHLQVLSHAHQPQATDPAEFCRCVGISAKYATEFRKMLSLARLMDEQGIILERRGNA